MKSVFHFRVFKEIAGFITKFKPDFMISKIMVIDYGLSKVQKKEKKSNSSVCNLYKNSEYICKCVKYAIHNSQKKLECKNIH